jgi:RNA polymerase sigma factor (sigma-70 family)
MYLSAIATDSSYDEVKKTFREMRKRILDEANEKKAAEAIRCLQLQLCFEAAVDEILVERKIDTTPNVAQRAFAYYKDMISFARTLTQNREDAEDLVQNTFVRVQEMEHKYQEQGNLKGWLFKVLKNIFISDYRKGQRMDVDSVGDDMPFNGQSSSPDALKGFAIQDAKNAINLLEPKLRCVCELFFLQGYKYEQISEELDLPLGTVKNRVHMGRKEIIPQLAEYVDTESKIKQYDKFKRK